MRRDPVEQAWMQGFDAGSRLLPSSGNPFRSGSELREAWFDGWCNGNDPDPEEADRKLISA